MDRLAQLRRRLHFHNAQPAAQRHAQRLGQSRGGGALREQHRERARHLRQLVLGSDARHTISGEDLGRDPSFKFRLGQRPARRERLVDLNGAVDFPGVRVRSTFRADADDVRHGPQVKALRDF